MLPLDDERWSLLTTFFGEPQDLPRVLEDWLASVGFDQEEEVYARHLCPFLMHQATIVNAAFAVAPWLVEVCRKGETRHRIEYLTDVGLIEANRLTSGVKFAREGTEAFPDWLMPDYLQAIGDSRFLADDAIDEEPDEERKRGLVAMRAALYGDAALAWARW
ncbi:MAG TPA: hypothetical protein VGN57_03380 [Pirellulaceae bacterium]|nr:hypothetical protein [Pirellulaceae bacterium]